MQFLELNTSFHEALLWMASFETKSTTKLIRTFNNTRMPDR